jgi:hypothetical protein
MTPPTTPHSSKDFYLVKRQQMSEYGAMEERSSAEKGEKLWGKT